MADRTRAPTRRWADRFRPRSLQLDLTVLVAIAGLPAIILVLVIAAGDRADDIARAQQHARDVADGAAKTFERMVRETHGVLLGISALPAIHEGDGPACSAFLAKVLEHGDYANLAAIRPDGTVFCSAHPAHGPVVVTDREYFQRAMASREFSVGGIHRSRVTDKPSVGLALPLLDGDGKVEVLLYAGLQVDVLGKVLADMGLEAGTRAFVVDVTGTVLATYPASETRWIGTNFGHLPIARAIAARHYGSGVGMGIDGTERVAGFRDLRLGGPEAGSLAVVVSFPLSAVVAAANRRFVWTLLGVGMAVVLALLVARWLANVRIGRRVRALATAAARLSEGDLTARTGVPRDPDEIGRLAAAFDGMAGSLERSAAARDALEEDLRRAQKLEAVGRLAGGVAHDFNNLLTAILSYGRFLEEDLEADDPRREDVAEILRAGDRAKGLTRRLLAFGRRQPVAKELLALDEVVADAERMLHRLLGGNVVLEVRRAGDAPPVLADPGQLEQVVVNLVMNARDAMPRGGTVILETGRALRVPAGGGVPVPHAVLAVIDEGVGMDEEIRAHLFEPFFTTKAPGQGTGLGLATVFGIVQGSGGTIEVDTEVGMGTTMRVLLPAVDPASVAAGETGAAIPSPAAGRPAGQTVLVVDDDGAVRAPIRRTLAGLGFRTLEARNAAEALAVSRAEPGPIDLLVSDVRMPGRSGVELALDLRAERPGLVALLVSGYTDRDDLPGDLELLEKPFTPEALADRVQELLARA